MPINRNVVQAALITKLSNDVPLDTLLTTAGAKNAITELSPAGIDFLYPVVRVSVGNRTVIGDGNKRHANHSYALQFYIFSEDSSSKQADDIALLVESAVNEDTLALSTGKTGVVDIDNISAPIQVSGLWQVLVTGSVRVAG